MPSIPPNDLRSISDVGSVPFRHELMPEDYRLGQPAPSSTTEAIKQFTNGKLDEYIQRRKVLVKELTALNSEIAKMELLKQIGSAFNATTD